MGYFYGLPLKLRFLICDWTFGLGTSTFYLILNDFLRFFLSSCLVSSWNSENLKNELITIFSYVFVF